MTDASASTADTSMAASNDGGLAPTPDDGGLTCAICLEPTSPAVVARLPCCTIPATATTQYCARCIEIVIEHGPGRVGRCPNCRSYLQMRAADRQLEIAEQTGHCSMCRQLRVIVEERGPVKLCDGCLLGTRHALRYECQRCRRFQRIPHPMWRYQPEPNSFGDVTWFCHLACQVN